MSADLIALLSAASADTFKVLVLLGSSDCDPNFRNSSNMTPLKAAIMNCDSEMVEILANHGAIVDTEVIDFAQTKYPRKTNVISMLFKLRLEQDLSDTKLAVAKTKI